MLTLQVVYVCVSLSPKLSFCLYLKESEGGGARQTAVLNDILIGQVIKPFHHQMSGVRSLRWAEVREITSQKDNGKQPPTTADDTSWQSFGVRASTWQHTHTHTQKQVITKLIKTRNLPLYLLGCKVCFGSLPCRVRDPAVYHKLWRKLKVFCSLRGWLHSHGLSLHLHKNTDVMGVKGIARRKCHLNPRHLSENWLSFSE